MPTNLPPGAPRPITAADLARPVQHHLLDRARQNNTAKIKRSRLIDLLNQVFGPEHWSTGCTPPSLVSDRNLRDQQGAEQRYVTAQCVVFIECRTATGTLRRQAVGIASANARTTNIGGAGALELALKAAHTNGFKRAVNLIGRAFGSELSESTLAELQHQDHAYNAPAPHQPRHPS